MALLNRFSKLNDRGETGIFTFIVTKSVTRDLHRDATTKDFCFGYHRWAISFQRPTEKMLGVHLLLRNASPSTACVVDFSLTLLNREHFSQNQVYSKKQAKFTITNPMQGVSRWIELSELAERRFSNETGEFLFELSLSNMTTIFECDIQLNSMVLSQYKQMLKFGSGTSSSAALASQPGQSQQRNKHNSNHHHHNHAQSQLINLDTNHFTFGSFDWSLTIVPLVVASGGGGGGGGGTGSFSQQSNSSASSSQDSFSLSTTTTTTNESGEKSSGGGKKGKQKGGVAAVHNPQQPHPLNANLEPVCRVYLNRLSGFDSLCRVKYRVILGHHQPGGVSQSADFVDSKHLDQISDCDGRIRGHQFRHTNVLKLASLRHNNNNSSHQQQHNSSMNLHKSASTNGTGGKQTGAGASATSATCASTTTTTDLRVHIEMFCANTISEARVPLRRATPLGASAPNEPQVANCSDRNKQNWCVECDGDQATATSGNPTAEDPTIKLKLFFLDLQSVPRNHIRYISWIAYLVRHDPKTGQMRDSLAVRNAPHSNYYLQDGMDLGTIMETDLQVAELNKSPKAYLDANDNLTVHIEWVDSLLLFSHLYNNYDALATVQRHQISRELFALQQEFDYLEAKYLQSQRTLNRLLNGTGKAPGGGGGGTNNSSSSSSATAGGGSAQTEATPGAGALEATNNNNNNNNGCREPPTTTGADPQTGGHRQRRQSSLTKTTTMDNNFETLVSSGAGADKTTGDGIELGDDARVPSLVAATSSRGLVAMGQQQLSGRQSQPSDLAAAYQERPTSQMSLLVAAGRGANMRCASSMSLGAGQHEGQQIVANYNQQHHHPHQGPSGRLSGGSDLLALAGHSHSRRQSPIPGAANRSPRQDASDHNNNSHHHHHHQQQDEFATTTATTTTMGAAAGGQVMAVTSHHHQAVAAPLTPSRSSTRRRLPQPKVAAQAFGGQLQRDLQSPAQAWHLGLASGQVPGASFENLQPLPFDVMEDGLFSAETADQQQHQVAARLAQRNANRYHEARHSADSTCATRRDSGQRSCYSPTTVIYPHASQQPPPPQMRSERLMSAAAATISHSGGGGVFMHNSHQSVPPLDETSHLAASPIRVRTLSGSVASKADDEQQSEPGEFDNHNNSSSTGANHQHVSMSDHRLLQQQQQQQHGHYAMKIPFASIGGEPQIGTTGGGSGIQLDDASLDLLDDNNQLPLEFTQPRRKLTLNGDCGPELQNGHLGSSFSGEQSSARRRQRSSAEMSPIRMTDQLAPVANHHLGPDHHGHLHDDHHLPALSSDHIDQLLLVSSTKRALSLQQPQEYATGAHLDPTAGQYDQQHPISPRGGGAPALQYRSGSRSDPLVQPATLATWQQQTTFERGSLPYGDSPP